MFASQAGFSCVAPMRALLPLLVLAALAGGCGDSGAGGTDAAGGAARPGAPGAAVNGATGPSAAGGRQAPAVPDFSRANLVIISLDTLRADATQMLGGPPQITPAMADFAAHGVLFTQARTQAPHTAPSHMSLFTSTYPSVHGVQNVAHEKAENGEGKAIIVPLPDDIPTLAEVLTAAGFRSVGLTDGGNLNPPHGFARGFERYTYDLSGAQKQVDEGIAELDELTAAGAGRFFLVWHTYQIHAPYVPPAAYIEQWAPKDYAGLMKPRIEELGNKGFKERFGAMKTLFWKDRDTFGVDEARYLHGLYHGNVDYTDDELSRLFGVMQERGVFDTSIVVLLSDHGESFFEHGHWQHEDVYEECLRVPLIIRFPGDFAAGRRIDVPVGLIDVMPTVLDLLKVDSDALELPGRIRRGGFSLAEALLTGTLPKARPIISEHIATRGGNFDHLVAFHANGKKFIYDEVRGEKRAGEVWHLRTLYDLAKDPGEKVDLVPQGGPGLKAFEEQYDLFQKLRTIEQSATGPGSSAEISPEMLEQLIELGYIDASAAREPGK